VTACWATAFNAVLASTVASVADMASFNNGRRVVWWFDTVQLQKKQRNSAMGWILEVPR
jgi:hypothetical protein